jgi:hypothetical protein
MFWIIFFLGRGVVLGKRRFIFMQMKSILHVEWLLGCQKGGLEVIIYKLKKYFSITSNIILAVQQNYDRLV